MKAYAKSLRFLGEGKELSVPFFQRRYVWKEENWDELYNNFENPEATPYLGSIIIKEMPGRKSTIIDGQQRLTTITLLAKAIYDSLTPDSKQPGSGIRMHVESFLFYRNNAADDFEDSKIKISHSRIDKEEYEKIIRSEMFEDSPKIDLDTINNSSSNIARCYKYFREKLLYKGNDYLKRLFNTMFDEDRKVFVLIELEYSDISEQTIFDTINRAGVRLNTSDIIKNNLYKHMMDAAGSDRSKRDTVISTYEANWENVFYHGTDSTNVWDEERVFGNVKHTNLEFLLYCIACIKWGEDCDMFPKLEEVYERELSAMGYVELKSFACEIKDYAIIFKKYILDFKQAIDEDQGEYFKYTQYIRRLLLILQKFKVQMFYPYILMRLKESNQDETDIQLKKDFHVLESFVVRRKISPRGTNDYTSLCYTIIKNGINSLIKSDLANNESKISDYDIKNYLSNTKDDSAKMILFWIELYRRNIQNVDVDVLEYKFTLEHIMPKKWETNWSDIPIYDRGVELSVNSEEGKEFRNTAIQSIGNKTLLTFSLNSSIKNAPFHKKVNGEGAKVGYKKHTYLTITQDIVDSFENNPIWNEERIGVRQQNLYEEFLVLWPTFSEEIHETTIESNDDDPNLDMYTSEQLSDPLAVLESIPFSDSVKTIDEGKDKYLSKDDFIKSVSVQAETVERYIREGKITPDYICKENGFNKLYFASQKVKAYVESFGWEFISDFNRKDFFIEMVKKMDMTHSYKPIFLLSILNNSNQDGVTNVWNVVSDFRKFFNKRREQNLIVEKPNSVYLNAEITDLEILNNILNYPFKRFKDFGVISYDKDNKNIVFDSVIWNSLTQSDKELINAVCYNKLEEYFSSIN